MPDDTSAPQYAEDSRDDAPPSECPQCFGSGAKANVPVYVPCTHGAERDWVFARRFVVRRMIERGDPAEADRIPNIPEYGALQDEIEHLRTFIRFMDDIAYLDHDDIVRLHGKYAAIPGMADAVQRAFDSDTKAIL